MPKALVEIEYDGSLADSLRGIANLVDEYGEQFLGDPTAFYTNVKTAHGHVAIAVTKVVTPICSRGQASNRLNRDN